MSVAVIDRKADRRLQTFTHSIASVSKIGSSKIQRHIRRVGFGREFEWK